MNPVNVDVMAERVLLSFSNGRQAAIVELNTTDAMDVVRQMMGAVRMILDGLSVAPTMADFMAELEPD